MLVKWEGGGPPDKGEWIDVLRRELDEEAGTYWFRFYREAEGWRFDLEYGEASDSGEHIFTRADESVAQHLYTLLVDSGRPLDRGWRPFAPSLPAATVATVVQALAPATPPVAEAGPAPVDEAPAPASEGDLAAKPESVGLALAAPAPEPEQPSEPQTPPAPQPHSWPAVSLASIRSLRPVIVYLPAVLLVVFAGWLSRDRLLPRPAAPTAPSPSAPVGQDAPAAETRLKELEAVVAQLRQERAQELPGRRLAAPAPIRATRPASEQPSPQPLESRADEIPAPTPTPVTAPPAAPPAAIPEPITVPLDAERPVDTAVSASPVPAAGAEPPPTLSPVQRGALVDVNDPDLAGPVAVTQTKPRYPPLALERRLSGKVWLNALVNETGAVVEVSLLRASPRGMGFEEAATTYARARAYRPATKQGVPVRVWLPIVVEFQLAER